MCDYVPILYSLLQGRLGIGSKQCEGNVISCSSPEFFLNYLSVSEKLTQENVKIP